MKGKEILGRALQAERDYRVKTYDFKRPDKFSKEQIRTVSIMHETFARLATAQMSAALRSYFEMHVCSVDQATFQEYIDSIPNPTLLSIFRMTPLTGNAILHMEPSLTFPVLERLFGGNGNDETAKRDVSVIEQAVLRELLEKLLSSLGEVWQSVIDLRPEFQHIESNPLFAQIVPPGEMTVIVTFQIQFGELEGQIDLCFPYLTIEPIVGKLSARYWYSEAGRTENQPIFPAADRLKSDAELYIEGEPRSLRELGELTEGSLIRLEDWEKGNAYLEAGGVKAFSLKRQSDSTDDRFTVSDLFWSDIDIERIRPGRIDETGKDRELAPQMEEHFKQLAEKISLIASRQNEILDQIYFSSPERDIPKEPSGYRNGNPFSYISMKDTEFLFQLLQREHPQLAALILSYLDTAVSSIILPRFSGNMQVELIERIASLDFVSPDRLDTIARVLKNQLKAFGVSEGNMRGGVETASEILNRSRREVEKRVIEELEKSAPRLAQELKDHMFVFEDIILLSPEALKKIVRQAGPPDLALALKTVDEEAKIEILNTFDAELRKQIASQTDSLARVKLSEVEAAQQRIIALVRGMEADGEVEVPRPGESIK